MDETKLHEFMGEVVTDIGGAYTMAMVLVGDELGLYHPGGAQVATRCRASTTASSSSR